MNSTNGYRRKLLLITSGCNDVGVGEVWSSFQWVTRLAQRHEITVLTCRGRHKESPRLRMDNARVVEWDDIPIVGKFERFNAMVNPGYVMFYSRARSWIKNL